MKLRLILLATLCLGLTLAVKANDEEATVTVEEDVPNETQDKTEEISYVSPIPKGHVFIAEHFDNPDDFEAKWVRSQAKKDDIDEEIAKYDGKWAVEAPLKDGLKGDYGLVLKSKAKHAAISASLDRPFQFTNKPLIVQYDVTFQNGQECGGAYIKLLTQETGLRLSQFRDKTPYTIMFGPDKCGNDHKLHFIFRHKNPKDGTFSEKHAKKPAGRLDDYFKDGKPHLYTLAIYPDNTFEVYVDYKVINKGSLLEDFTPPVNPPVEIDDPEDHKPEDWDEREKIPDPDAKKPEDWDEDEPEQIPDESAVKPDGWLDDEPDLIPDPSAEKPEDWDEDIDGTWEAPLIENPACGSAPGCGLWKPPMKANPKFRGKWRPAMIDNPNYKGKWRPRRIPNPDFFEDKEPFKMSPIGAIGLELWSMSDNILFDNIIITDDKAIADEWAADTFELKMNLIHKEQFNIWEKLKRPKYWIHKFSRWTNKNDWFWVFYGAMAFSPVIGFIVYLFKWSRTPEDVQSWKTAVRRWINRKSNAIMVYAMYLSLPATLYIWFLRRRVIEESLVQRVVNYTNKSPWLWALYVVVIGLPLVLIFTFCCGSSKEKQEQARAAKAKKTDEPVEDDEAAEEDGQLNEQEDGQLNEEEDGQLNEDEAAPLDGEEGEEIEAEQTVDEPEQTNEEEAVEETQPKASPRRRKVRKD